MELLTILGVILAQMMEHKKKQMKDVPILILWVKTP
jgi:hypothetical protein